MTLIDGMNQEWPWAFGYCKVTIGPKLTEGSKAFHITLSSPLPAGRIWLTRFGKITIPAGEPYLVFDIQQNQSKTWRVEMTDSARVLRGANVTESGGHLVLDTRTLSGINLGDLAEVSLGALAPLDTSYMAILDYMRTEASIPPPIQLPLSITVSPTSMAITIGQTATLTAFASGGTPPYGTIEWIDNATGAVIGTGETYKFTPMQEGTYQVYAKVGDMAGSIAYSGLATIRVTPPPPPPPPTEPTPPNTSHIKVVGYDVEPLHKALWYPWFIDTSSGWLPRAGEKWSDINYTRWDTNALRAILRDIRDTFGCNCIRVFFWMDWVINNKNATISTLYPATEIGNRDALHALCDIAQQEGLDVELRMWGWTSPTRKIHPLIGYTETDFINAWVWFAKEFAKHPNVMFNLYDEPDMPVNQWIALAYNTTMQIRASGVGHVIYLHYLYCGGEGINWIRQFGNHYNVAFSRHEYIYHGTTEAMHQENIQIHSEGYPVTVTAGGAFNDNPAEIETYKRWWAELLDDKIGISIYTYGRPNVMGFRVQQDTFFPCPPNNQGIAFRDIAVVPPTPPTPISPLWYLAPIGAAILYITKPKKS